jgi:hypothetical protein
MGDEAAGWWASEGYARVPPDAQLHEALRWVIRQLNLGFAVMETDSEGRGVTLVIGQAAARSSDAEATIRHVARRDLAVNVAGLFAESRERGTEPRHQDFVDEATQTAEESAYLNTEVHYALQLMDVLERLREHTFRLPALPILKRASEEAIGLLAEATKCYLYGFHKASVALCRAALERFLKERVAAEAVEQQRREQPKKGELEVLINAAGRAQLLDSELVRMAHGVRVRANDVLHATGTPAPDESLIAITDTRLVVERLFAGSTATS